MCSVPQLRAFDARVLAGCGIEHPQTLAEMHPGRLLKRVEQFLTTAKGQEILRSGSNYELSRITTWIASARRSLDRNGRRDNYSVNRSAVANRYRLFEDGRREPRELRNRRERRSELRQRRSRVENDRDRDSGKIVANDAFATTVGRSARDTAGTPIMQPN